MPVVNGRIVKPVYTTPKPTTPKPSTPQPITSTPKPTAPSPGASTKPVQTGTAKDRNYGPGTTTKPVVNPITGQTGGLISDRKEIGQLLSRYKGSTPKTPVAQQPKELSLQEQMQMIADMFKQQQEAYMAEQKAMLGKARDSSIAELQKAYADAVAQGEMSVREAEEAFKAQSGQIEEQAYLDSQATKLAGEGRGIGNSQQMLGMMTSDNAREMNLHNTNTGSRDKRVADIRDRIGAMTKQKDLDVARLNSEYEYNLAGASASAQQNLMNNLTGLYRDDLASQRDYWNNSRLQDDAQGHDKDMQNDKFNFDKQLQELGFKHEKDIETLRHNNTLVVMAKEFGYDIKKMDKQQVLDLARMAKQFGYDLNLQNDAQSHDKSMQDDAQAHDSSMQAAMRRAMSAGTAGYANSPGALAGNQNAIPMSESDMYNAIIRQIEQQKRTANPGLAPIAPLPGSIANENKQRRLFDIWN